MTLPYKDLYNWKDKPGIILELVERKRIKTRIFWVLCKLQFEIN